MSANEVPLWPGGKKIKIIGVTGDFGVGKTLFGLSINPASTLVFDCERSSEDYEELGFKRVDLPQMLHEKLGTRYSDQQQYDLFSSLINKVPAGKYSVICIDTVDTLESGLVASIKSRHADFGFSSAEAFIKTGGIFWAHVNSELKRLLLDASARCQTLFFATHMRNVWKWGAPTGEKEPKGKAVLMQLANLYLELEKIGPGLPPAAHVLKGRMSITKLVDGETRVQAILPDRLPFATPNAIRQYILNPPDFSNLSDDEKVKERQFSESDKLMVEAKISEDRRAAAEASASAAAANERVEEVRRLARERKLKQEAKQEAKKQEAKQQEAAAVEPPAPDKTQQDIVGNTDIEWLMEEAERLGVATKVKDGIAAVLGKRGVAVTADMAAPSLLTQEEFERFRVHLLKIKKER